MPLFRCETCGCIENTATGFFYGKDAAHWPDEVRGKALCSACAPAIGPDGKPTGFGAWHGEFARETATGMLIDNRGFLRGKGEALPSSVTIVGVVTKAFNSGTEITITNESENTQHEKT